MTQNGPTKPHNSGIFFPITKHIFNAVCVDFFQIHRLKKTLIDKHQKQKKRKLCNVNWATKDTRSFGQFLSISMLLCTTLDTHLRKGNSRPGAWNHQLNLKIRFSPLFYNASLAFFFLHFGVTVICATCEWARNAKKKSRGKLKKWRESMPKIARKPADTPPKNDYH